MATHYQQDIAMSLLKKLALYATGREPDVADLANIRSILDAHAKDGIPLRDALKSLLRSNVFLGQN